VVSIHHARDPVKSEAIKHEYIHVISQVGQEEPQDFVTSVVEQSGVPELMSTACSLVEVLMVRAIKLIDTFISVEKLRSLTHPRYSCRHVSGPCRARR
jgi:hypothetical protein